MLLASIGHPGDKVIALALLIMRLSLGLTVMMHGYRHIYGGGKIAGTAGLVREPRHEARHRARLAGEPHRTDRRRDARGGTARAGRGGSGDGHVALALITNHWKNGFFIFNKGEGYEYVLMIVAMSLALGTLGAGKFSLDKSLKYPISQYSAAGFWITLILGVGGTRSRSSACSGGPRRRRRLRRRSLLAESGGDGVDEQRHRLVPLRHDADVGETEDRALGSGLIASTCAALRKPTLWLNLPPAPMLTSRSR